MKRCLLAIIRRIADAILTGVILAVLAVISVRLVAPGTFWSIQDRITEKMVSERDQNALFRLLVDEPITLTSENLPFTPWQPLPAAGTRLEAGAWIGQTRHDTLQAAVEAAQDGDTIVLAEGIYTDGASLNKNHITIEGQGHVVFDGAAVEGKGTIVTKGSYTTIRNIECRNTRVRDRNGACVRHQGEHLLLDHVYFHDSEQGILTGNDAGLVQVHNSRFENLGAGGRAHGIYTGGGELEIVRSLIIRSRGQGHEVKSRARRTVIRESVIASFDGDDSRLIDIPNGGELIVENSVLAQGMNSANGNMIGYGFRGLRETLNKMTLVNNVIIGERPQGNRLLQFGSEPGTIRFENNVLIGSFSGTSAIDPDRNFLFDDREGADLAPFPFLPTPWEED